MTGSLRRFAVVAGCSTVIVSVLMMALEMEPRPVLVACVVVLVAATTWLVVDVAMAATPLSWYTYGTEADTTARPDQRVQVLRARLRRPSRARRPAGAHRTDGGGDADSQSGPSDEIVDTLLAVVDDHLIAEHGVDRATDPDAAARVLGPELAAFVNDPTAQRSMTQRRTLARTVAMIEAL